MAAACTQCDSLALPNNVAGRRIDLLFVEMVLPDRYGIWCAHELKREQPGLKVVLSSTLSDRMFVERAFAAGIDAYLVQPITHRQCLATLWFVGGRLGFDKQRPRKAPLTFLENQILADFEEGLLYKEIEEHLSITHSRFRKLQQRIFRKLSAENRTEAVNKWRYLDLKAYHENGNAGQP